MDPRQIGPAIDGRLLPRSTAQAFASRQTAAVPLIIGSNSYEASLMDTFKIPKAAILAIAPASLKAAYADLPTDEAKASAMFTDAIMGAPAPWIAGQAAGPAYLYHFAYVPTQRRASEPGAGHDTEIPFVFDSWDHLGALARFLHLSDEDRAMTTLVHGCWVAFAKSGDPSCAGWPPYHRPDGRLLLFDTPAARVESSYHQGRYDAQEAAVLPKIGVAR